MPHCMALPSGLAPATSIGVASEPAQPVNAPSYQVSERLDSVRFLSSLPHAGRLMLGDMLM